MYFSNLAAEWKKKFPEISDALKTGKEVVDYQVENALLDKALDGDTTAQIFWLKNRRPDKWRDKPIDNKQQTAVEDLTALAEKLKVDE